MFVVYPLEENGVQKIKLQGVFFLKTDESGAANSLFPGDYIAQLFVEVCSANQLFKRDVHAITPILIGVGGHIDLLFFWLVVTQTGRHGEPILPSEQTKHGG